MVKVAIVIYSLYHHIYTLAQSVQEGLKEAGVDAQIYQGKKKKKWKKV